MGKVDVGVVEATVEAEIVAFTYAVDVPVAVLLK